MAIQINIDGVEQFLPKRVVQEISRESHRAAATKWHRQMLPKHFQVGASSKYGYKQRTSSYLAYKRRQARNPNARRKVLGRGETPLVFTGLMRDLLKRKQVVRAYPTRSSLNMAGPRYVSMRPFRTNHPNLGEEATAVMDAEAKELDNTFEATFDKLIRTHLTRSSRVLR